MSVSHTSASKPVVEAARLGDGGDEDLAQLADRDRSARRSVCVGLGRGAASDARAATAAAARNAMHRDCASRRYSPRIMRAAISACPRRAITSPGVQPIGTGLQRRELGPEPVGSGIRASATDSSSMPRAGGRRRGRPPIQRDAKGIYLLPNLVTTGRLVRRLLFDRGVDRRQLSRGHVGDLSSRCCSTAWMAGLRGSRARRASSARSTTAFPTWCRSAWRRRSSRTNGESSGSPSTAPSGAGSAGSRHSCTSPPPLSAWRASTATSRRIGASSKDSRAPRRQPGSRRWCGWRRITGFEGLVRSSRESR